ncbi:MAG TPA: histidine phosphatase family protein [Steroidobacteraceae bacterium]|jgi:phosphohistidine phosphatase
MKQLLLLRHAHAQQSSPGGVDIDRPLSARGRAEALAAARSIVAAGLHCDALLASPALRTRQTAAIVAGELGLAEPLRLAASIYLGDAEALLEALGTHADGAASLLLVAHNPGISELAQRLQAAPPAIELRTAGLCLIEFDLAGAVQQVRLLD